MCVTIDNKYKAHLTESLKELEDNIANSKNAFPGKWIGDKRICSTCNTPKDIDQYPTWKRWNKKKTEKALKVSERCIDCKRKRDRERLANTDPKILKQRQTKATKKYKQSDKYDKLKQKYAEISKTDEYRESSKIKWLIKKNNCSVFYEECSYCNDMFVKRTKPQKRTKYYCSDTCKYIDNHTIHEKACIDCDTIFLTGHNKTIRCNYCQSKVKNDYTTMKRIKNRMNGSNADIEFISRIKVFTNANWECKICGCKTQKDNLYADDAAELDHITPISKGGSHTYNNVQLLCRKCNWTKAENILDVKRRGQFVMPIS